MISIGGVKFNSIFLRRNFASMNSFMCNSRVALYIDEIKAFFTNNDKKKIIFVVILTRINEIALSDIR